MSPSDGTSWHRRQLVWGESCRGYRGGKLSAWLGDRGACGQQGLAEVLADQLWDRTSPSNGLPVGE